MIVNPGGGEPHVFVGEDGALYSVSGVSDPELSGLGLFLGEDGGVYRAEAFSPDPKSPAARAGGGIAAEGGSERALNGYLLGADGTLYRVA
jgi:hypothetical protein